MGVPFVQRTHFEICRFIGGKLVGQPIPIGSLQEAKEEAVWLARGDLLDDRGNRAPSLPVYELDVDEEPGPDEDGLFIRRVVTRVEATVVY
jgi:hypothetical protein